MSNKTQLQTNNTALDGYITRINAAKEVAAGLPEAGGGGSDGGSVETIDVTIKIETSAMGGPCISNLIYTTVENGTITNCHNPSWTRSDIIAGAWYETAILTCVVGTTIYLLDGTMAGPSFTAVGTTIETVDEMGILFAASITSLTTSITASSF